jgi:hypothetical protein
VRGFGIGPIKSNSSGFASNNSFFDSTDLKDEKAIGIILLVIVTVLEFMAQMTTIMNAYKL